MRAYVIRRLLQSVVMVFVLITLMFFLFRLMPADPSTMLVEGGMPEDAQRRLLEDWGLTGSTLEQYLRYLANLATVDFGTSFFYKLPVWEVLVPQIVNTLWISVPGVVLGTAIGCALGVVVGWARRGGPTERGGILFATLVRGCPAFVLGLVLLMVFSTLLGWFPGFGMGEPTQTGTVDYLSWSFLSHLTLPVAALTIYFIPETLLLMRTGVVENRGEEYLDLLRAKGVREPRIAWHAARNSLLPVVTWVFPALAETVAGIVIIEVVFSWPGVGRELVLAVTRQDFPVAQAAFFLLAVMIVLANLLADLVYTKLDPRVVHT